MPSESDMAVWDACVLIDAIQKHPDRWALLQPYLADAERREFSIVVSEATVAEVRYLPILDAQGMTRTDQVALIKEFFDNPYIIRRAVTRTISGLAVDIGTVHNLKRVGDALAVATAVHWKVPMLHTFDGMGKSKGLIDLDGRLGSPTISICCPNYARGTLFEEADNAKNLLQDSGSSTTVSDR